MDFDPRAARAVLEQLESLWRDVYVASGAAVYKTAREAVPEAEGFAEVVTTEYLRELLALVKAGARKRK